MRRAIVAVAGTATGLAALLSYKSGPVPPGRVLASGTSLSPTPAPSVAPTAPSTVPPTTGRPTTTASSARSTTTSSTAKATTRTVDGPTVQNRYGPVQVEVVVSGGRLTDVRALQLPSDRARSAAISSQAGPMLRSEALSAQSAAIDGVSGATYTSQSYAQSLQAALDQARR